MATAIQPFMIFKAAIYIWHLPSSYALVCAFNTFQIKRGYSKHNMYKAYEIQLQLRYCVRTILSSPLLLSSLYSYLDCIHLKNGWSISWISSALHMFCNMLCMLEFLWLFLVTWSMLCVSFYQLNWSWTEYCLC